MGPLETLGPFGKHGELRMIVESPRGLTVNLKYDPELALFTVARALLARPRCGGEGGSRQYGHIRLTWSIGRQKYRYIGAFPLKIRADVCKPSLMAASKETP